MKKTEKSKLYSFDVFDTLITRSTATPQGIFALMKDQLWHERECNGLDENVIDNFFELRIHSETLIRETKTVQEAEEIQLQDIYAAMHACGYITREQAKYLCCLEQNTEIANVIGIPENIGKVKALLESGERVVLISDMYLSEKVIRKMLLCADEIFLNIPLYVSSKYGKRKTTGNLYREVRKLEKVEYEDWMHYGDNLYQDITIPYYLGIKVELFPTVRLTDFEKDILDRYGGDSGLQRFVGAACRAERNAFEKGADKDTAYHIGCRYAGPVLYSYAEWIVKEAVCKKINRLYFIARDGYLIKQIVDIILTENAVSGITTKYIYGSRKAWRMPSLSKEHYNLYQLVLWSHTKRIRTLDDLAFVLHIELDALYTYLPGTFSKEKEKRDISDQETEFITAKLAADEKFKEFHLSALEKERKTVQRYLAQEIDVSDERFAFVEVSGGGLTQGCLRELLKDRYEKPIRTFFFKIDRVGLIEKSITDVFMPGFLENNLAIEMVCRAPHGQTKGYSKHNGYFVPNLEETEKEALTAHGFYSYEKGILDFSKQMLVKKGRYGEKRVMRQVLLYLELIAQKPPADVREYFASMPNSESGRDGERIEYAPRLTEEDMKEIFLKRLYEPLEYYYKGTNLEYSIMRATPEERALIEYYKKEHDGIVGKLYRQERMRDEERLRKKYGRAAFYPLRLLEEKIILYGAGRFGQDLYRRIKEDSEHEVVLWVDKNAENYRGDGFEKVCDVDGIGEVLKVPIVIAVMKKELADVICDELKQMGIEKERLVWIRPCNHPYSVGDWKRKGIG